ncbi:MAG: tetratricopeptide repeat protein, partial [Pirellulales bacterium]
MDTSGRLRATLLTLTVSLVLTTGCITTSPKLALRWPSDIKREKLERSLSLARLSERQGKFNDALAVYQKILESDPNNVTAHHRIGAIAVKEGRLADGRQEFERAAALGKPSAELLNDLGYLCYLEQDLPRAESQLRAALSTDPRYKNAHNNLGLVLAEMGRFDEALAEFKLVGSEAEAYSNLAYIQTKMGQLVDAERNYHKALSLDNSLRPAAEALLQLADLKSRATGTPPPGMMARQPTLPTVRQAAVGATPEAALIESVELGRPAVQPATVPTTTAPTAGRDRSVPGGRNAPSQVVPASGVESNDASVFADSRFDAYSWSGETPPADARTAAPANAAPSSAAPGQTPRNP